MPFSMDYVVRYLVAPLLASLFVSTVLTYLIRGVTHRLGLLDKPGQHKQHLAPTLTLGGLPVFLAVVVGCLLSGPVNVGLGSILQASILMVGVGVCDDIWGVRAKFKLSALFLSAFWLWTHGIHLDLLGQTGIVALVLTLLWIGPVSSAFNGVDNADGAAAGLAVISSVAVFCISWTTWQHDLATISLVMGGACFGFLLFNFPWPRATIFLGDSGSLFLGFSLAALMILGEWSTVGLKSAVIATLLVFMPLFDFLISRGIDGRYKHWQDPIEVWTRSRVSSVALPGTDATAGSTGPARGGSMAGYAAFRIACEPDLLTVTCAGQAMTALAALGLGLKHVALPKDAFAQG